MSATMCWPRALVAVFRLGRLVFVLQIGSCRFNVKALASDLRQDFSCQDHLSFGASDKKISLFAVSYPPIIQ